MNLMFYTANWISDIPNKYRWLQSNSLGLSAEDEAWFTHLHGFRSTLVSSSPRAAFVCTKQCHCYAGSTQGLEIPAEHKVGYCASMSACVVLGQNLGPCTY